MCSSDLVVETVVSPLRFVPLFAEIADSIPLYLEIAADDRARKVAGTPALAGALLKIGAEAGARDHLGGKYALNIAGPDRIRQLVAPVKMSPGLLPAAALSSVLTPSPSSSPRSSPPTSASCSLAAPCREEVALPAHRLRSLK